MNFGLSLSGLLQHSRDGDMVQRFADVLHLVRVSRNGETWYPNPQAPFKTHARQFQDLEPESGFAGSGASLAARW